MAVAEEVLGTFHGSDEFPIEWQEGEKELFWIYDDLHIPNPVSPMFFDIGGWWLTCDHMFRRFGTPFACDWIAKEMISDPEYKIGRPRQLYNGANKRNVTPLAQR